MKIIIDQKTVSLTPNDILNLKPTFTLRHGRRFSLEPEKQNGFKNVSLNKIILAIKRKLEASTTSNSETLKILKAIKSISNKGYNAPYNEIDKKNCLSRIFTRVKHFFSNIKRKTLLNRLTRKAFSKASQIKTKRIKPTKAPIDESKNYLKQLPKDVSKLILERLDPVSRNNFSKTSMQNLRLVQDYNPNTRLQAQIITEALVAWKLTCQKKNAFEYHSKEFAFTLHVLMKSFPKEVLRSLDKAIDNEDQNLRNILKILELSTTINAQGKRVLLEKANRKIAKKSTYPQGDLHNLALAFGALDPIRALQIVHQIHKPHPDSIDWKLRALEELAGKFLLLDEELSFDVASKLPDEQKINAYENILNSCQFLDKKKAASLIDRVIDLRPMGFDLPGSIRLWSATVKAYILSGNFDQAFTFIQNSHEQLPQDWKHLLLDEYLRLASHCAKTHPDLLIKLHNTVLSLDGSERTHQRLAQVYLKCDPEKAQELLGQLNDEDNEELKIDHLIALAQKNKTRDQLGCIRYLDQALLLATQIKLRPRDCGFASRDPSDILAFIKIIRCYTFVDPDKAKKLIKEVEAKIEKIGFKNGDGDRRARFHEMQVIPSLAKAYLFIDPKYALHIVNQYLAEHPCKAFVLLKLAKMLERK